MKIFYLIPLAFLTSFIIILLTYQLSLRISLVDKPSLRKKHQSIVPLTGGLSIYISSLMFLIIATPMNQNLYYLFLTSSIVFIFGLIDDFKTLPAIFRMLIQGVACLILIQGTGLYLYSLGDLFGLGEIVLGFWGIPITVFCVIGVTNAFNMIDGMDGLAGSIALIAIIGIFLLQIFQFQTIYVYFFYNQYLLFIMIGIIAFLIFNLSIFTKKKIFLGDSGSTFLGYVIACSLIGLSQGEGKSIEPVDALWVICIPLMDTIVIIFRRLYNRLSPFNPDRRHLHHILINKGLTERKTLLAISSLSIFLILLGVFNSVYLSNISFFIFFIIFLFYIFWNLLFFVEDVISASSETNITSDNEQ